MHAVILATHYAKMMQLCQYNQQCLYVLLCNKVCPQCINVHTYEHIYSSIVLLTIFQLSPLAPLDNRNCITLECP